MSGVPQRLRAALAGPRGRALAVVAVVAVTAALGVGFASAPAEGPAVSVVEAREAVASRGDSGPAEAAFRPLDLDVDAFVEHADRLAEKRRSRAQDLLDQLYPGLAFVTVSVDLDPRWERTTERVQPEMPAVVEEERPDAGGTGSRRRVLEPFAGTRETGMLAPDVRRVSVALVLDESIASDRRQRDSIVATVSEAVGPVGGQAPDVEVLVDRFPRSSSPGADSPASLPASGLGVAGSAAVIALLALVFAWFWLRRGGRSRVPRSPGPAPPEAPGDTASPDFRCEIEKAIERDPALVSRMVEGWLTEERK